MTDASDRSDSFISMVLALNGRVRPADLHAIPEAEREAALCDYLQRHGGETPLHIAAGELVAGVLAPTRAVANGALVDGTAQGVTTPVCVDALGVSHGALDAAAPTASAGVAASDLDLLLGGYEGAPARDDTMGPSIEPVGGHAPSMSDDGSARERVRGSSPTPAASQASTSESAASRTWLLWWVPTLVVPLLGGAAAWFALRDKRARAARVMLAVGIVAGMIASVLFVRYAEPLAVSLNSNTKITMPSTTAKPDAPGAGQTPQSGTDTPGGSSTSE